MEENRRAYLKKAQRERELELCCAGGGRLHTTLLPELVFLVFPGVYQWKLGVSQPLGLWSFYSPDLFPVVAVFLQALSFGVFFFSVCFLFLVFSGRSYTSSGLRGAFFSWCLRRRFVWPC
jgi:hypothetical protein